MNRSATRTEEDGRWAAVVARDAGADGRFVYAVRSTNVFCRPSCPSRLAHRANVTFYETPADALGAGFRPCRRCRPDEASSENRASAAIARACRAIRHAQGRVSVAGLAAAAGMSRFHFQRVFKQMTGITPGSYASACRAGHLKNALRAAPSVTDAIYDAGFSSSGPFYAQASTVLGMVPSAYRRGAEGTLIRRAVTECSLGLLLVAATDRGVCSIALGNSESALLADLRRQFPGATIADGDRTFGQLVARVVALVESPRQKCTLPLDIQGTVFQQKVWSALRRIPAGTTATYADVARAIGRPSAARAVARACASNKLAVAIPCHRVVAAGGQLSGYRWGASRKRKLLNREA